MPVVILRKLCCGSGGEMYCWARGDLSNNPKANGEYWLLEQQTLRNARSDVVVFDVGAHMGYWSLRDMPLQRRQENESRFVRSNRVLQHQ